MNAMTKAAAFRTYAPDSVLREKHNTFQLTMSKQTLVGLSMIVSIVLLAFAIVYTRGLHRHFTAELQSLQYHYQELTIKENQLLLEQNAWSTQARVQAIAQSYLDMKMPQQQSIKMVTL